VLGRPAARISERRSLLVTLLLRAVVLASVLAAFVTVLGLVLAVLATVRATLRRRGFGSGLRYFGMLSIGVLGTKLGSILF
jgi:hypothetical protein